MSSPTVKEPNPTNLFKAPPKAAKYIAPPQDYVAPQIPRPQTVPTYFDHPPVYQVPYQPRAPVAPITNNIPRPTMPADISIPQMPKNGLQGYGDVPQTSLNLNNGQFEDYTPQYN